MINLNDVLNKLEQSPIDIEGEGSRPIVFPGLLSIPPVPSVEDVNKLLNTVRRGLKRTRKCRVSFRTVANIAMDWTVEANMARYGY